MHKIKSREISLLSGFLIVVIVVTKITLYIITDTMFNYLIFETYYYKKHINVIEIKSETKYEP